MGIIYFSKLYKEVEQNMTMEYIHRTVKLDIYQSQDLSRDAFKAGSVQRIFFNHGVELGQTRQKHNIMSLAKQASLVRKQYSWVKNYHTNISTSAFIQGYNAAMKFNESNFQKARKRRYYKKKNGKNHNWWKPKDQNKYTNPNSLFRTNPAQRWPALVSNGHHPSIHKGKWKKYYINFPGIGRLQIKNMPEQILGDMNEQHFFKTEIVACKLVDKTRKITKHTNIYNHVFKLHLTLKIPKPTRNNYSKSIGVDPGVKNALVVSDGNEFAVYNPPDDAVRHKRDLISQLYSQRKKFKPGSNNYGRITREIGRASKKQQNRQLDWECKTAKKIMDGVGMAGLEATDVKKIGQSDSKNLNREIHYKRMGALLTRLEQTGINNGTMVIHVLPAYTSQICSRCGRCDKHSRYTRDNFKCVVCQYCLGADENASENIRFLALPHVALHSKVGGQDSRRTINACTNYGASIDDKTRGCNTLAYTSMNAKHPFDGQKKRTFVVNPG